MPASSFAESDNIISNLSSDGFLPGMFASCRERFRTTALGSPIGGSFLYFRGEYTSSSMIDFNVVRCTVQALAKSSCA